MMCNSVSRLLQTTVLTAIQFFCTLVLLLETQICWTAIEKSPCLAGFEACGVYRRRNVTDLGVPEGIPGQSDDQIWVYDPSGSVAEYKSSSSLGRLHLRHKAVVVSHSCQITRCQDLMQEDFETVNSTNAGSKLQHRCGAYC